MYEKHAFRIVLCFFIISFDVEAQTREDDLDPTSRCEPYEKTQISGETALRFFV